MSQTVAMPKRLSYPTALIDRNVNLLRRELRRWYREYRRGALSAVQCLAYGENSIQTYWRKMRRDVAGYMQKKGLKFFCLTQDFEQTYEETLQRWRRIVASFTSAPVALGASDCGCTKCAEYRVFSADEKIPYWSTRAGITRRIDGLSQDFMFKTVNGAMKVTAVSNGVRWMRWVTAADDRVCPVCLRYGSGGDGEGYYRVQWFMPITPPAHFGCRCQYELVLGDVPSWLPQND